MGTDDTHAGLPVSYRTSTAATVQPTCRAISLAELTRRGPVVVLAPSLGDIGAGAAGMVMATLETSHASLFTLDGSAPAPDAVPPRLDSHTLPRTGPVSGSNGVDAASERVRTVLDALGADTLFVATVPVTSADHRFVDLVARRVASIRPCTVCWHFAAMRRTPPGASYLLRSDAVVRTFDVRRWSDGKERLSSASSHGSVPPKQALLPELYWQDTDVSALSRLDAVPA